MAPVLPQKSKSPKVVNTSCALAIAATLCFFPLWPQSIQQPAYAELDADGLPIEPPDSLGTNRGYFRLIDTTGKFALPQKFSGVPMVYENTIVGAVFNSEHKFSNQLNFQIFNRKGEVLRSMGSFYRSYFGAAGSESEGLIAFVEKDLSGFIDQSGKVVIPAKYNSISDFKDGLCAAKKGPELLIIDKQGAVVWTSSGKTFKANQYGLLTVQVGNRTFLARQYSPDTPIEFGKWFDSDQVTWTLESQAVKVVSVKRDGTTKPIGESVNTTKEASTETNLTNTPVSISTSMPTPVQKDNHWQYVDEHGKVILELPKNVTSAYPFNEGVAVVKTSSNEDTSLLPAIAAIPQTVHEKTGFIDLTGKYIVPPTYSKGGTEFIEDRLWVSLPAGKEEKIGYINKKGEVVIPPSFDGAQAFSNGLAVVYFENPTAKLARLQTLTPEGYEYKVRKAIESCLAPYIKLAKLRVSLNYIDGKMTITLARWCGQPGMRSIVEKILNSASLPSPPPELAQRSMFTIEYSASPEVGLVTAGVARDPFFAQRKVLFELQKKLQTESNQESENKNAKITSLREQIWLAAPIYSDWEQQMAGLLGELVTRYILDADLKKAEAICLEAEKRKPGSATEYLQQVYEKQKRFAESEILLSKLVDKARLTGDINNICYALLNLGNAQYIHGNKQKAGATFKTAALYCDSAFAKNGRGEPLRGPISAAYTYACFQSISNNTGEADFWFDKTLKLVESISTDWENNYPWVDSCQSYLQSLLRRTGKRPDQKAVNKLAFAANQERVLQIKSMPKIQDITYAQRASLFPLNGPGY